MLRGLFNAITGGVAVLLGGCFSLLDFGGHGLKDVGNRVTLVKRTIRPFHVEAIYGNKPLRDFVFRCRLLDDKQVPLVNTRPVYVRMSFGKIYDRWKLQPHRRIPLSSLLTGNSDDCDYLDALPDGFTWLAGDDSVAHIHLPALNSLFRLETPDGFDWSRFGRYCYQVPLDLVTSPVQVPVYLFFAAWGVVIAIEKKFKDEPSSTEPPEPPAPPKSWTLEDVMLVLPPAASPPAAPAASPAALPAK